MPWGGDDWSDRVDRRFDFGDGAELAAILVRIVGAVATGIAA